LPRLQNQKHKSIRDPRKSTENVENGLIGAHEVSEIQSRVRNKISNFERESTGHWPKTAVKFLQLLTADSHPVWRFPFDAKTFSRLYLGSTLFFWGCLVMDRRKLVLLACSLIAKFHEYLESLTLLLQRRRARRRKLMLLLNILVRRFLLERGCISAAR
jgi:hypothetical protein